MEKIIVNSKYFNIRDTLECGQIFRFTPFEKGYLVFSRDKVCYAYTEGEFTVIETDDYDYFYNFFDLDRDYSECVKNASSFGVSVLETASQMGRGIRILNQDREEALFSFIISQNNNIPRIKTIIERLCVSLGDKKQFGKISYYSFPSALKLAEKSKDFFASLGLGYRDTYLLETARKIKDGFNLDKINALDTPSLRKTLIGLKGVGEKVADCVTLFGFHRFDSFPVDTWIYKLYRENFGGTETDRKKVSKFFTDKFKNYSGIIQQYLFYYKRTLEEK